LPRLAQLLDSAAARLSAAHVPTPRHDAELLLAHLLETDRGGLLIRRTDEIDPAVAARFEPWIARREAREPLQHILGEQEFHGLSFRVDPRALIPRPETEGLVDAILALDLPAGSHLADLGAGGGCISVAVAVKNPGLRIHAVDRSHPALELARDNARRHGVCARIEFEAGEMSALPESWSETMDAVFSNPPYARSDEWEALEPEVRDHDPKEAIVAGPTGLEAYEALVPEAARILRVGGTLVLELGYGQAEAVRAIVAAAAFANIEVRPDLRGIPRVLVAEARRVAPAGEGS